MMQFQTTWGWLVATYLFLGGLGAGVFLAVALIALISGSRYKATIRFGAWTSVAVLTLGSAVLLLDVGVPLRAIVLFKSFVNLDSWMARGAWFLFAAILVDGLFALLWTDRAVVRWRSLSRWRSSLNVLLGVVGMLLAIAVAAYTGLLLNVLPFRPFWNSWLLPALFTASALDTGVGLTAAYASLREKSEGADRLRRVLETAIVVLVLVEGAILASYLLSMLNGSADSARSAQLLVGGVLSPFFWVLVVGLGLALPLLVSLRQLNGAIKLASVVAPAASIAGCLVGGFALRAAILAAGLPATLSSPGLIQILSGVRFVP